MVNNAAMKLESNEQQNLSIFNKNGAFLAAYFFIFMYSVFNTLDTSNKICCDLIGTADLWLRK